MKILNLLEMEKALLEEHVRYGEARFRDKELVRPFVNRIYQDLAKLEEAMKPKNCADCENVVFGMNSCGSTMDCKKGFKCSRVFKDEWKIKNEKY